MAKETKPERKVIVMCAGNDRAPRFSPGDKVAVLRTGEPGTVHSSRWAGTRYLVFLESDPTQYEEDQLRLVEADEVLNSTTPNPDAAIAGDEIPSSPSTPPSLGENEEGG